MTDKDCRVMPTRVCPRSLPDGCKNRFCARFESDEHDPEVIAIWEEHWRITDQLNSRCDCDQCRLLGRIIHQLPK